MGDSRRGIQTFNVAGGERKGNSERRRFTPLGCRVVTELYQHMAAPPPPPTLPPSSLLTSFSWLHPPFPPLLTPPAAAAAQLSIPGMSGHVCSALLHFHLQGRKQQRVTQSVHPLPVKQLGYKGLIYSPAVPMFPGSLSVCQLNGPDSAGLISQGG